MSTPKSQQTSKNKNDSSTQDHTSLMQWLAVPFLVVFLVIRLLPSLVKAVLVRLFSPLLLSKTFLDNNPDGYCLYFDTEAAVNKGLLESRGIDLKRLVVVNVVTIEDFRQKALRAVDIYLNTPTGDRKPCMFVLDSLGMLSTEKEIRDALDEKQVRDMTKSQLVKGAFRMLTLKLGQANIPLIVTNHTYDVIGSYVPTKEMGGGSGLKYASSTIIYLSKKKKRVRKRLLETLSRLRQLKADSRKKIRGRNSSLL